MITIQVFDLTPAARLDLRRALAPIAVRGGDRFVGVIDGWQAAVKAAEIKHNIRLDVDLHSYDASGAVRAKRIESTYVSTT